MLYYSIAGTDFTSITRTVIFNVGVVSARVEVTILDDTAIENTETFTASLTSTQGNVVITNAIATVSILDDFDGELSTYILLALPLLVKIIACNKLPRATHNYHCYAHNSNTLGRCFIYQLFSFCSPVKILLLSVVYYYGVPLAYRHK